MFREIILPIIRSTRLCGIMHARFCRPPASCVHYTTNCNTQSSAAEYGQNNCPKLVELTGIINKPLLLHLVGCLYFLYKWRTVKQISDNEIYLLIKYIKSVLWRVAKCLSYIEEARCLKVNMSVRLYENLIWIATPMYSYDPLLVGILLKYIHDVVVTVVQHSFRPFTIYSRPSQPFTSFTAATCLRYLP